MRNVSVAVRAAVLAVVAGLPAVAVAQPRMTVMGGVGLGFGPTDLSSDGSIVLCRRTGGIARWTRGTAGVQVLGGSLNGGIPKFTTDGQVVSGPVLNTPGYQGLPTAATLAGRWASGVWSVLPPFTGAGHA